MLEHPPDPKQYLFTAAPTAPITAPTTAPTTAPPTAPPTLPKQLSPDRPEVLIQAYLAEKIAWLAQHPTI
jgi:hypothetical protein